jgi:predicted ATPase
MPLFTKIMIRGFKSLRDVTLELGQLNVFIGENGAGKSNLLEAVGMLAMAMSGSMDYNNLAGRGVRLSTPEVFKSSFRRLNRPKEIRLEADLVKDASYKVTILPEHGESRQQFIYKNESFTIGQTRIAGRSHNGATIKGKPIPNRPSPKTSILTTAESYGAIPDKYSKIIEQIAQYGIYAPATPILRGVAIDESRKEHLGLYGGSLSQALNSMDKPTKGKLEDILMEMFKWIRAFGTISPHPDLQSHHLHTGNNVVAFIDSYMKVNFRMLYAYDVSEGALYVLFVLCLLLHKYSPHFFALDNIDSALNPGLVTHLIRHIVNIIDKDQSKQVLLTSHNPTTLDALDLFNNNHRLFSVERGEDGSSCIRRIKPPEDISKERWSELLDGMKMSDLWLSGSIGALHKG